MKRFVMVFGTVAALLSFAGAVCAQGGGSTTTTGTSNKFNPALSVNSLFLASWHDPASDLDGFKAQEIEVAMSAVVDPYFSADVFVAYEPDPEGPEAGLALEEVYARALALPAGWGLRAGRFFIPFGRHNQLHTHVFPFVEAPLAIRSILGEESAGDVAIEGSYLPDLDWFLNLIAYVGDGAVEGVFDGESRELAAGARAEGLWDLSEATTLESGLSFWDGPIEDGRRTFLGADVRVKYVDIRRSQGAIVDWITEFIIDSAAGREDQRGLYSLVRYRFLRRWWMEGGYSLYSFRTEGAPERFSDHEIRTQIAFAMSEFSALRLDLSWLNPAGSEREFAAQLQFNFNIGSHPAHTY